MWILEIHMMGKIRLALIAEVIHCGVTRLTHTYM